MGLMMRITMSMMMEIMFIVTIDLLEMMISIEWVIISYIMMFMLTYLLEKILKERDRRKEN